MFIGVSLTRCGGKWVSEDSDGPGTCGHAPLAPGVSVGCFLAKEGMSMKRRIHDCKFGSITIAGERIVHDVLNATC